MKKEKTIFVGGRGFTLIELLVVIAIIGILTVIGVTAFNSAKAKANDSKRKSDLNSIYKAAELYAVDEGTYPYGAGATSWTTLLATLKSGGYITNDVQEPLVARRPGNADAAKGYCYGATSDGSFYRLAATLENASDKASLNSNDGGKSDTWYEIGNALGDNTGVTLVPACPL